MKKIIVLLVVLLLILFIGILWLILDSPKQSGVVDNLDNGVVNDEEFSDALSRDGDQGGGGGLDQSNGQNSDNSDSIEDGAPAEPPSDDGKESTPRVTATQIASPTYTPSDTAPSPSYAATPSPELDSTPVFEPDPTPVPTASVQVLRPAGGETYVIGTNENPTFIPHEILLSSDTGGALTIFMVKIQLISIVRYQDKVVHFTGPVDSETISRTTKLTDTGLYEAADYYTEVVWEGNDGRTVTARSKTFHVVES